MLHFPLTLVLLEDLIIAYIVLMLRDYLGGEGEVRLEEHMWLIKSLSIIKCLKRLVHIFTFEDGIVLDSHSARVKN